MEIDITNNYINIQGWMCSKLKLSGNELLIYALIYGFSQDGVSEFRGSRSYICKWFNISLPTVDKALNSLVEKNLITKREEIVNNVKYNCYKVILQGSKESLQGVVKNLYRGGKESLHNNTNNNYNYNNTPNTIINNSITRSNRTAVEGGETKKLLKKSKKTKKDIFIDKFLKICDEFDFSDDVLTKLVKFATVLTEMNFYPAEDTIRSQLIALSDKCKTDRQRITVIDNTIIRGWKSLIYCIDDKKSSKDDRAEWDTPEMSNEQSAPLPGTPEFEELLARGEIHYF